jgi:subtilisin family serine protease
MLAAALLAAQTVSTRCQTEEVKINAAVTVKRLVGCGEGFPENTLWHLDRIDSRDGSLDETFTRPEPKSPAVVYVMDSGVETTHDEFQRAEGSNVIGGFVPPTAQPVKGCDGLDPSLHPCLGNMSGGFVHIFTHGTGVASLIAGKTVGVAPDAKIISVLTAFSGLEHWVPALDKIIENAWDPSTPQFRTAIINISGGAPYLGNSFTGPQREALDQKIRDMVGGVDAQGRPDPTGKRFLFVAAAGNWAAPLKPGEAQGQCDPDGNVKQYPASIGTEVEGVISVGGMTNRNEFWSGSCRGPRLEVLAPAENMLMASNTARDHYRKQDASGTSWSTPIVSGIAALLLGNEPDLSPAELERRIESLPSRIIDTLPEHGGGRVPTLFVPARRRGR